MVCHFLTCYPGFLLPPIAPFSFIQLMPPLFKSRLIPSCPWAPWLPLFATLPSFSPLRYKKLFRFSLCGCPPRSISVWPTPHVRAPFPTPPLVAVATPFLLKSLEPPTYSKPRFGPLKLLPCFPPPFSALPKNRVGW